MERGMQSKTIKKVLKSKVRWWLDSIDDEKVKELAEKNTIVTGGSIASMLMGEEVNDYDLYFRDFETAHAVALYYVDKFQKAKQKQNGIPIAISVQANLDTKSSVKVVVRSAGVSSSEQNDDYQYFESVDDEDQIETYVQNAMNEQEVTQTLERKSKKKYEPIFLSSNAITLTEDVQIVLRFFGEPDEIHENYDYAHCMNYYDYGKNELVLRQEALECILSKTLKYNGSLYPIASIIRSRKFINRGWKISAGQYLKMIFQVNELDLTDVNVLQEQLTGVDAAYFSELINKIQKDGQQNIDATYIAKIVDEMF